MAAPLQRFFSSTEFLPFSCDDIYTGVMAGVEYVDMLGCSCVMHNLLRLIEREGASRL